MFIRVTLSSSGNDQLVGIAHIRRVIQNPSGTLTLCLDKNEHIEIQPINSLGEEIVSLLSGYGTYDEDEEVGEFDEEDEEDEEGEEDEEDEEDG